MRSALNPAIKIESLESRRLMAAPGADPAPGMDLQFLSDLTDDTTPVVTETVDPVKQVSLPGGFKWFDSTSNKDLIAHGGQLGYILVDGWNFWPRDSVVGAIRTGDPSETNTRWFANYAATVTDTLVVDIEEWQMDLRYASKAVVDQNIARFQNILSWIRQEQPNLKIGIYSIFPVSDLYNTVQYELYSEIAVDPVAGSWYRGALPGVSNAYAKLQNSNAYLSNLAASVDYIFPAIYSSSPDLDLWTRYAKGSVFEARRYGKPVIPFLMPTYHHAAASMNQQVVPAALWQAQLNLMPQIADGAIIWTDPLAPVGVNEYWITIAINTINGTGSTPSNLMSNSTGGLNGPPTSGRLDRLKSLFAAEEDGFSEEIILDELID